MKIDNKTLTKIKFILNEDDAWVSRTQIAIYAEDDEQHGSSDDEFEVIFKTASTPSSHEHDGYLVEDRLQHIETEE